MVRRARGWVPEPILLPEATSAVVVATGGHLQVTACVTQGRQAFPSQHVGDLDSSPARAFLAEVIEGLLDFLQVESGWASHAITSGSTCSWLAEEMAAAHVARIVAVQHHLAHVAAVLAEHGRLHPVPSRAIPSALSPNPGNRPCSARTAATWAT